MVIIVYLRKKYVSKTNKERHNGICNQTNNERHNGICNQIITPGGVFVKCSVISVNLAEVKFEFNHCSNTGSLFNDKNRQEHIFY